MRIYISGPITGYADNNRAVFQSAKRALQEDLWGETPIGDYAPEVVNPLDLPHQDQLPSWSSYLKRDIAELLTCDAVATLPGWQESRGAQLEVHIARELGLTVKPLEAWLQGR